MGPQWSQRLSSEDLLVVRLAVATSPGEPGAALKAAERDRVLAVQLVHYLEQLPEERFLQLLVGLGQPLNVCGHFFSFIFFSCWRIWHSLTEQFRWSAFRQTC